MIKSNSSMIKTIDYDALNKTLKVTFSNDSVAHYHNVSEKEHKDFVSAPSHGKHFHSQIKTKFKHVMK